MRAVWYERNGAAAEVLSLGEMGTPAAGPGEVLVAVRASGVNPADTYWRRGSNGPMAGPRVIPNSDGSGVVETVGAGVDAAWVGQRVWLYNGQRGGRAFGTAADYIALSADLVSVLPAGISFAEGATLGIPCMTAHRCVFAGGSVEGRWVVVTGGGGAASSRRARCSSRRCSSRRAAAGSGVVSRRGAASAGRRAGVAMSSIGTPAGSSSALAGGVVSIDRFGKRRNPLARDRRHGKYGDLPRAP